jgi:hypothetical protein
MAERGDLERVGRGMARKSRMSRRATDGNKNVQSRARRKSPDGQLMRSLQRSLKGPGV